MGRHHPWLFTNESENSLEAFFLEGRHSLEEKLGQLCARLGHGAHVLMGKLTHHLFDCHLCLFHGLLCFGITVSTGRCDCTNPHTPALASGVRGLHLGCFSGSWNILATTWLFLQRIIITCFLYCTRQSLPHPLGLISFPAPELLSVTVLLSLVPRGLADGT